ncbi:MAG: TRIC cation channel family protein, partial [Oscillospiraceae bacterium]|nr:TRIC cation channel family protein [Oscillospiraceae bacterium]
MDATFVFILEVIGTVTFAFSGAYVAINQDLDWLGIVLMAVCTACGGGMTRDVIIDNTPANLFKNPTYVIMAVVTAFITIALYKSLMTHAKRKKIMFIIDTLDAVGLAIFTVVGMQVAQGQGFGENAFLV